MVRMFPFFPLCLLAFLVAAPPALAGTDWELLANLDDDKLRERLVQLAKAAEDYDADTYEGVFLMVDYFYDIALSQFEQRINFVWMPLRDDVEDLETYEYKVDGNATIEELGAFHLPLAGDLRASPVQRLDAGRVQVDQGSDDRDTEVVIAFPDAGPGQVLGFSMRVRNDWVLGYAWQDMAMKLPTVRAEMRVRAHRERRYSVLGQRMPEGKWSRKILDRKKEHIRDQAIVLIDLEPVAREPFAPPGTSQSPRLFVLDRGRQIENKGYREWFEAQSWDEAAVFRSLSEAKFNEGGEEALGEFVSTLTDPSDAGALYLQLREELQGREASALGKPNTIEGVLQARSGSRRQKSWLMARVLHDQGIPARVAWAHEPDNGKVYDRVKDMHQLPHPLVLVGEEGELAYYDFGCRSCPPGAVNPRLQGAPLLDFPREIGAGYEGFLEKIRKRALGSTSSMLTLLQQELKLQNWARFERVPERSPDPGVTRLVTSLAPAEGDVQTAQVELEGTGYCSPRIARNNSDDALEFMRRWLPDNLPGYRTHTLVEDVDALADTVRGSFEIEIDPLPPVTGDRWILPARQLVGEPCFDEWEMPRETPLHIARDEAREWVLEIPLPEGFVPASLPEPVALHTRFLDYGQRWEITGDNLRLLRVVKQRRGSTEDRDDILEAAQLVLSARQAELRDVVLIGNAGDDGR